MKSKLLSILALLLTAVTQGAWAQTDLTPNANKTVWSLASMPAYDIDLYAEYYTDLNDGEEIDYSSISGPTDIWLARTLKAGSYNTFASPVDIDADGISALGITAVKELKSSSLADNTLTLNFENATSIEAGKPYLVKVSTDVEVGAFDLATVSGTATSKVTANMDFVPTLGKTQVTADAECVLFLGAENKLYNPSEGNQYMKGFRAYFLLKDDSNQSLSAKQRSFRLDFGDGEQTTGILSVEGETPATEDGAVYDLMGRRLNGLPAAKGVYIIQGKKVVR